jgi:hypothetical protein
VDILAAGLDRPPAGAITPDAQRWTVVDADLDGALAPAEPDVTADEVLALAGRGQPVDPRVVDPLDDRLILVVRAEPDVLLPVVETSQYPFWVGLVGEIAREVERMRAGVEEVGLGDLDADQLPDLALVKELFRFPERLAEAALVVDREANPVFFARLGHLLATAPGGRHWLFTVDSFRNARPRQGGDNLGVGLRRDAHADHVGSALCDHLLGVFVKGIKVEGVGERLRVLCDQVGTGDQFTVVSFQVSVRVSIRHGIPVTAGVVRVGTGPDERDFQRHRPVKRPAEV